MTNLSKMNAAIWPRCPFHHKIMNQVLYKGEMWFQCFETGCGHKEYNI